VEAGSSARSENQLLMVLPEEMGDFTWITMIKSMMKNMIWHS
jgi:hypothetical protein